MHHADPGPDAEQFHAEVSGAAGLHGTVAQLAGPRFGVGDQFRHVRGGQLGGGDQYLRRVHELGQRHEVALRIEGQIRHQQRQDHELARRGEQEGVAVGRGARGDFHGDHAAATRPGVHDHLLPEHGLQALRDPAADEIGRAARRVGDQHADGFARVGLRGRGGAPQQDRGGADHAARGAGEQGVTHEKPHLGID